MQAHEVLRNKACDFERITDPRKKKVHDLRLLEHSLLAGAEPSVFERLPRSDHPDSAAHDGLVTTDVGDRLVFDFCHGVERKRHGYLDDNSACERLDRGRERSQQARYPGAQ